MRTPEADRGAGPAPAGSALSEAGGLLDLLNVAAVVLDADGRIVLWSPQAQKLFGWTAEEVLGRHAKRLLVTEEHFDFVLEQFARVMSGGSWAGVFPVKHKDGSVRPAEFRNMRLQDEHGALYALGLAADSATLREVERDLALSARMVAQSPIGLAVLDTDLRYVMVNPVLERINGRPAAEHIGRRLGEMLPFLDSESIESAMRQVLATGVPQLDQFVTGRPLAEPDADHAWMISYYRLEDPAGRILGVACSVVDVTERHRAAMEAGEARRRLAVIANASLRIGTTLDLETTARELADVVVPDLADIAAVDVLDSVLEGLHTTMPAYGPAVFRSLALAAAEPSAAVHAADPIGEIARYDVNRLVTRCVTTGRPVLVTHVRKDDLAAIARDPEAAALLCDAGLHSYLAVPLIARGEVLGALDLARTLNRTPFDQDDVILACELAARAAVCIDNARWYQSQRQAAVALQRHLLPHRPTNLKGLRIAYRYQPATATAETGGDWFDAIAKTADRTALVVGDVVGHGINAAATMGQLRTATQTLADLGLDPACVLHHLDRITGDLEETMATCVYAEFDPLARRCVIASAGHMPPVLIRRGQDPELLDLPTGVPLGVGGVEFESTALDLAAGDRLLLYTDGLVETRDQPIDARLDMLLDLLAGPGLPLEATCDRLLTTLRRPDTPDDVVLLVAEVAPR